MDKIARVVQYKGRPKKYDKEISRLYHINTTDKRRKLYHRVDRYAGRGIYENDLVEVDGATGVVEFSERYGAFLAWVDCQGIRVPYYIGNCKKIGEIK